MIFRILITPFVFAVNSIGTRAFQTRYQKTPASLMLFLSLFCLVASAAFFFLRTGTPDLTAVLLAVAFGVLFFVAVAGGSRCYEIGPMSLTTVLENASLLLPVFWSAIVLDEIPGVREWIGIAVIFVAIWLSSRMDSAQTGTGKKWWLLLLAAFLANGSTAIIQKMQQLRSVPETGGWFLSIAYLTACLCFVVAFAIKRRKESGEALLARRDLLLPLLICVTGLSSFGGNWLLQELCTTASPGVLYPIVNGGLCVVTAAASFLIFKERFTSQKLAAILTGIAGIVILTC